MTVREKVIGILLAVVLAIAGFVGYQWLQEHDARLKAEGAQAAQAKVITDAQKTIEAAKAEQQRIATDLQDRLDVIAKQKQQPITAPQFVVDLNKLLPNLPQQPKVVQPPPTEQIVDGMPLTVASDPVVMIPAADLQALRNYKLGCDETGARLDACTLSSAAKTQTTEALQTQLKATEVQRDTWEKTAKGGSLWHRTLTVGKWIVIGGAIGYVAARKF